jgi:hypothetical protein
MNKLSVGEREAVLQLMKQLLPIWAEPLQKLLDYYDGIDRTTAEPRVPK